MKGTTQGVQRRARPATPEKGSWVGSRPRLQSPPVIWVVIFLVVLITIASRPGCISASRHIKLHGIHANNLHGFLEEHGGDGSGSGAEAGRGGSSNSSSGCGGATKDVRSTHNFFLAEDDVERGMTFRGSGARAAAVAAKLAAGQAVHVAIVGGSVAWGQGAPPGKDFGRRFFDWVNATWPGPPHRFSNAAKPATTSALFALCATDLIPQDADIVVLEFAFNDFYGGVNPLGPERAAYEQLVRRVLSFPSTPAVLSLHYFAFWYAKKEFWHDGGALFYNTGEDDLAVIAQYYDVPVLSLRNAVIHHMYRNHTGYRVDLPNPSDAKANLTEFFYYDDHHPYHGTGHRAMTDLLVATMQDALADASKAKRRSRDDLRALWEPMIPGNYESVNATCILGVAFKDLVVRSQGFEWRPSKPKAQAFSSQKWAWAGTSPGSYAVLRLDTLVRKSAGDAAALARVYLRHTCSHRDLGTATVTCVSGCVCNATTMDNHWERANTQGALWAMEVTQHSACEIMVTVDAPRNASATPSTMLTGAMVDSASNINIVLGRWENYGQFDMLDNHLRRR